MKPSESQFTSEQLEDNKSQAITNGKMLGRHPGHAPLVEDLMKSGEEFPVSGAGIAQGKAAKEGVSGRLQRKDNKANLAAGKMGGVIQSGKLVKGGNKYLAEDLSKGKK
jgi:hypothetical protein